MPVKARRWLADYTNCL